MLDITISVGMLWLDFFKDNFSPFFVSKASVVRLYRQVGEQSLKNFLGHWQIIFLLIILVGMIPYGFVETTVFMSDEDDFTYGLAMSKEKNNLI